MSKNLKGKFFSKLLSVGPQKKGKSSHFLPAGSLKANEWFIYKIALKVCQLGFKGKLDTDDEKKKFVLLFDMNLHLMSLVYISITKLFSQSERKRPKGNVKLPKLSKWSIIVNKKSFFWSEFELFLTLIFLNLSISILLTINLWNLNRTAKRH